MDGPIVTSARQHCSAVMRGFRTETEAREFMFTLVPDRYEIWRIAEGFDLIKRIAGESLAFIVVDKEWLSGA